MIPKDADQLAAEQQELEESGAKFYKWNQKIKIVGTGKYPPMPEGKVYTEHILAAKCLIDKGYAKKQ